MDEALFRYGLGTSAQPPAPQYASPQQYAYRNDSPFAYARASGTSDNGYAGRLPHLYGGGAATLATAARPWSARGYTDSSSAQEQPPPAPAAGGSVDTFFSRRADNLTRPSPHAEHRYDDGRGDTLSERPAASAFPSYLSSEGQPLPCGSRSAGLSPIAVLSRQPAPPRPSLSGGHFDADHRRDPMAAPAGRAPTTPLAQPSARRPSFPRQPSTSASAGEADSAAVNEPESLVLERVVARQAELVESIKERLRAVQAKKQFMQERLAQVKEQQQDEMRSAAEMRGRLEEERAQCLQQLEQLQGQLEGVRAQRENLAKDYAARDAERRAAAERAAEEKEEVARIQRRLEELRSDMEARLTAEENRYKARVESAKAASLETERSAQWLTEMESRVAAAAVPGRSVSRS